MLDGFVEVFYLSLALWVSWSSMLYLHLIGFQKIFNQTTNKLLPLSLWKISGNPSFSNKNFKASLWTPSISFLRNGNSQANLEKHHSMVKMYANLQWFKAMCFFVFEAIWIRSNWSLWYGKYVRIGIGGAFMWVRATVLLQVGQSWRKDSTCFLIPRK